MSFFQELKRRNVFRVGVAYLLAAWVLLQAIDFVLDAISAPNWILQVFILAAAAGFLVVLVFSWVFEVTPEGIKRERDIDRTQSITPQTGRKLDRAIIVFLALAVLALLADRVMQRGSGSISPSEKGSEPASAVAEKDTAVGGKKGTQATFLASEKSIAVLPFVAMSSGEDDEYFADGLTEEILNSLAQLPELLVTARTSAFHFKDKDIPLQEIAATLGVGNIVEGSVRRSGDRLRVTAQLIRAADGFHLWSENYDSTSEDTIEVQEDIAEKIATAMDVVMNDSSREAMRKAGLRDVEAFIALQKGNELYEKAHGDPDQINLLRQANRYFEIVLQRVPAYTYAYQAHSDLYVHILLNHATNRPMKNVTPEEIDAALGHATADYQAAIQHASSAQERNDLEIDLQLVSSNWRGLLPRLERFLDQSGCDQPSWAQNVALPFGYADRLALRLHEFRICDPLSTSNWVNEARAMLWAGDLAGSLDTAEKGMKTAPGAWLSNNLVRILAANGQFEQAEQEIARGMASKEDAQVNQMLIAAAQGDQEAAAGLFGEYQSSGSASGFGELMYYAWSGDQQQANSLAAEMDSRPFGSLGLTIVIMWCSCGAPFGLSATPNLAQRLDEAGLAWPPVSTINFPLKEW